MYPIIINNEEELKEFVNANRFMIEDILDENENEGYETELVSIRNELLLKQQTIDELTSLKEGISKGVSSYHIGEFNEKILQETMTQELDDWSIDKTKKMHAMDIRLNRGSINIGIECKRKNKITKTALNKFLRDKVNKKFDGNIFISTCEIPKIIKNIHNCSIIDNNLYIYSDDIQQIISFIKVYIQTISESEKNEEDVISNEVMKDVFNNHNKQKKQLLVQDKVIVKLMRELGVSTKGFLYMGVVSKYKNGINPY